MKIDMRLVPEGHSEMEQGSMLEGFRDELPKFSGPVRCRAGIDRMGGTVAAAVRFSGVFEVQCARCLEDYGQPVDGELRVIIKEEPGRHGAALGDGDEGVDFFFDINHDVVDISSAIYDEIMIALPLKPLCSEGCEGIRIANAGGDGGGIDPRWEILKKLKSTNNVY